MMKQLKEMCEEFTEDEETAFIAAVRGGGSLSTVCYGSASSACGAKRAECVAGTYSRAPAPHAGSAPCWPCPRGSFQPIAGATACETCPNGTGTRKTGTANAEQCAPLCEPGFFGPGGVAPCEPCAAGSFQERPGAASCLQCAQGNSTLAPGASHRSQCIGSAPDSTNPSAIPRLAQNRSSSHRLVNSHEGDADVCVLAKSQRCVETDDWHGERGATMATPLQATGAH